MNSQQHRRVDAVIAEYRTKEFSWAGAHCCAFVSDVVRASTGADPMEGYRTLGSKAELIESLREQGGMVAAVTRRFGAPLPPLLAQYGDVVLLPGDPEEGVGDSLGICTGPSVLVTSRNGLLEVPLSGAKMAWSYTGCVSGVQSLG